MHTLLRAGILITFGILIICIVSGCTPVDDYEDDEYEEVTVRYIQKNRMMSHLLQLRWRYLHVRVQQFPQIHPSR